jgi:hypothetical protein
MRGLYKEAAWGGDGRLNSRQAEVYVEGMILQYTKSAAGAGGAGK